MSNDAAPRSRGFVTAFARGLEVIQAFGPGAARLTLSEVAARAGLDRAVARRLLMTLVELGMARSDGRQFSLTPEVLRLSQAYLGGTGLDRRLQPALQALARRIGESTSLTVLDWPHIVNVARAEAADRPFRHALSVSARMPAHATASGRVLMAALPEAHLAALLVAPLERHTPRTLTEPSELSRAVAACREAGFAVLDGELEEGFASAAVPLRDSAGTLVAALATSSHSGRRTAAALRSDIVPLMQDAARGMAALLG
ncbi:IclR family transcriptional regulator domain-containing protein [Roseomonas haemaphysalidis]|uniref:Helix-turn-helix domain-containing protein n=1 Tax=Roseomonas haemaphysalidis TaxID=2768162 RepID=A0ABS3KKZ8_9PROT|nr:IclR family transcriptional regulator C-terminal domain-containing protein [Roseomonas haemaphysalidis]MBO1078151.1 helix-turn-helix domain-containing protein [Roseomonas haemaphysalidis]